MGSTDDDDESIHQRLSSRTGEPIEIGAQQATGLLQRFHPDGDAERFVQSVLRQAKEDRKSTHQELRYGCGHSFGYEVRKDRISLSWLSAYSKHIDTQIVSMTTKGKVGRHWLSYLHVSDNQ